MTTEKVQNYTEAQTKELVEAYQRGESVEAIAMAMGKTTRSIIAKLSREGVYQAKQKLKNPNRVKKAELVDQLANLCGVAPEIMESLEKANHDALEALVAKLRTA
jgi:hypothetical protein